jgi:Spy/CpxP family protein refolding chaperone
MLKHGRSLNVVWLAAAMGAMTLVAQPPQGGGPGQGPGGRPGGPPMGQGRGPMEPNRPPVERMYGAVPPGRWWTDPATVQRLALTADQQKQIENVFQSSRAKLIDLNASLQKEEVVLEPLLDVDHPDEAKVVPQIDRVAQARAELEKANARMLLSFREVLNQEQWRKLQNNERPGPPPPPRNGGR